MSNELKLETLEDLLSIDIEKLKSAEKSAVITRVKQLLKKEGRSEEIADKEAANYPYKAYSLVGNIFVEINFDLNGNARVVNQLIDPRDVGGRNFMAGSKAIDMTKGLVRTQKQEK